MGTLTTGKVGPPALQSAKGAVSRSTLDWLATINKATTRRSHRGALRDFAAWLGGDVVGRPFGLDDLPVNSGQIISARAVRRYMTDVEAQGKGRGTINHRLSVVRKWVRTLEAGELIHPHRAEAVYHVRLVERG